jgi:D-glycero-alpha-D-manno-heptose-7-phosphate kinase
MKRRGTRQEGTRTAPARSRARSVSASAPSRIDLAGETLDIWPISVLVPRAVTVNLAIEARARVTITGRDDGLARVVSLDRRRRATRRLPLRPEQARGPLALPLRLVAAFVPGGGLTMTCSAEAPAGAGLGGSSTLAVAAAAALARWTGERLDREALVRRVMNHEAALLGVPTGNQDYLAAVHGGLSAYHHEADGTRREKLRIPEGLERRLVLAYTGRPRHSGFSNWEMFRRFVEGERRTVAHMRSIARISRRLLSALQERDLDQVGRRIGEEGALRYRLAPSVGTPELLAADRAARRAGALGVKVCGAGGGGCLVAFAREGRTEAVATAIAGTGARILPVGIARTGLRVASGATRSRSGS